MAQFKPSWLLYGASGYSGALIAEAAKARGLEPILAGRSAATLAPLAEKLGLKYRIFSLDDRSGTDKGLMGIKLVLNCAGPFNTTAVPLAQACIRNSVHYLDLAGEVHPIRGLQRIEERALEEQVMLMPGVGFSVLLSEALLAHIKARRPGVVRAKMAYVVDGGASRGTVQTLLESLAMPGYTRDRDQLVLIAPAANKLDVDFASGGKRTCVTNPWRGDLYTCGISLGLKNLECYTAFPWYALDLFRKPALSAEQGTLGKAVRWFAKKLPIGPSPGQRAKNRCFIWAEGVDEDGRKAGGLIVGGDAYDVSAQCALYAVEQVLGGRFRAGFTPPALLFGSEPLNALKSIKFTAF